MVDVVVGLNCFSITLNLLFHFTRRFGKVAVRHETVPGSRTSVEGARVVESVMVGSTVLQHSAPF